MREGSRSGAAGPRAARTLARGSVRAFGPRAELALEREGDIERFTLRAADAGRAVEAVIERLKKPSRAGSSLLAQLEAVGHRVVHGGDRFPRSVLVDGETIRAIRGLEDLAPLHNAAALAGIDAARRALGEQLPMAAVFDTAFFHDLPARAATYAIPRGLARRHRIRRYGFHGLSHAYLAERYASLEREEGNPGGGSAESSIVTLHLGSGCSAAAIRGGRPLDTSMGFTPLEGLVMGTRAGDLDPAVVGFLARREDVSAEEVEEWLNRRSGLLGVSGTSSDPRRLLERERQGDARAALALELFCYRARKYVGAYLAVLGGAEAVVFAGGVGENVPEIRARICDGLEWCGLRLDPERNAAAAGAEARIGTEDASIQAWVIPTREELCIARETARCVAESDPLGGRRSRSYPAAFRTSDARRRE